jgi:Ulp1 family protease
MTPASRRKGKPTVQYLESWKLLAQGFKDTTMRVDYDKLFTSTLYMVPVNIDRNHWGLLVLDTHLRTFTYYDSGNKDGGIPKEVYEMRKTLQKLSNRTSLTLNIATARITVHPNFPQQKGGTDCGIYVMMAARAAANRLPIRFSQEDVPYFRQRFAAEIVSGLLYKNETS